MVAFHQTIVIDGWSGWVGLLFAGAFHIARVNANVDLHKTILTDRNERSLDKVLKCDFTINLRTPYIAPS